MASGKGDPKSAMDEASKRIRLNDPLYRAHLNEILKKLKAK